METQRTLLHTHGINPDGFKTDEDFFNCVEAIESLADNVAELEKELSWIEHDELASTFAKRPPTGYLPKMRRE